MSKEMRQHIDKFNKFKLTESENLNISDVSDSEKTIKHIVKKTHYWLFKKTNDESKYYYVRTMTEGLDRVVWFMGYENHFGSVSSVGGELSDETQKQLESEFQHNLIDF